MKRLINFCILTILMSSCVSQKGNNNNDTEAFFKDIKTIKYVIGDGFLVSEFTSEDFIIIDEVLNKAISDNKFYFLKEKKIIELKKYYRQILVYTDKNNDKWVYINAMCQISDDLKWKEEMFDIADGGECYWNMKINLTKRSYHELIVNGYA